MMPRAGGQYVYLREALGPLWGFLYGWTLFLVIQTGTIAAVGVAFGKFLGIFFPSISSSNWIVHFWKIPPIHVGPMVLGNMDVGLSTQNLVAILVVVAAVGDQHLRRENRRVDSECLHLRQGFRAAGSGLARAVHRTQRASDCGQLSGQFLAQRGVGRATRGPGGSGRSDGAGGHTDHSGRRPGRIAVFRRRLEQRDFHRRRSEEPQPQSAAVTGAGHGRGDCAVHRLQLYLSERPAAGWQSDGRDHS